MGCLVTTIACKQTFQTCTSFLINSLPQASSQVWTLLGLLIGMTLSMSSLLVVQLLLGLLFTCTLGIEQATLDSDVGGFITIVTFIMSCRHLFRVSCSIFDDVCPCEKPPRWSDRAPYDPFGNCYGYAMTQYRVKKKSGHSRPKNGGDLQPITSRSLTSWFARMPFLIAFLSVISCG